MTNNALTKRKTRKTSNQ